MRKLALAALVALLLVGGGGATSDPWPPAPANLRVSNITADAATVSWGPTIPGDFLSTTAHSASSVTFAWGPADDPSGISDYTVESPDGTIWGTTATTRFKLGVGHKVRSVSVCVYATNGLGQDGPRRCGVYSR